MVPSGTHRLFRGYAANRSTDIRSDVDPVLPAIAAVPEFDAPTEEWYPWTRTISAMSGSICCSHKANTPPSSRTFDTVSLTPSGR